MASNGTDPYLAFITGGSGSGLGYGPVCGPVCTCVCMCTRVFVGVSIFERSAWKESGAR